MAIFQTTNTGDGAYIYPDQTVMKSVVLLDDASLLPGLPFAYSQIERPCNNYLKRIHKPKHRRWGSAVDSKLYFF